MTSVCRCVVAQGLEAVAAFLATDCSLRAIGLHYNGFGSQGATALAAALHTNQTLQELALYGNNIGPDGAAVLAAALAANRGVVSVDMGEMPLRCWRYGNGSCTPSKCHHHRFTS